MSVKPVREHHGKQLLARALSALLPAEERVTVDSCLVTPQALVRTSSATWTSIEQDNPWLFSSNVVAKPDQLIKRRGKAGLIAVNKPYAEAKQWIVDRMYKEVTVDNVSGQLTHFILEPFVAHKQEDEYYVCIQSKRYWDEIYFHHEGGVDVGDVDVKALRIKVKTCEELCVKTVEEHLLSEVRVDRRARLTRFVEALFTCFRQLHFTYLEINPLVMLDDRIIPLDLAAKLDETAHFLCGAEWGDIDFPPPFGRSEFPEEIKIREMDARSGASLKLTILNEKGRIWTMVAGGGASVVYADSIADAGFGDELANYGEYSGAPTKEETFEYAKTLFGLMTKYTHPESKVLIIGGGIANFTDVSSTFTGLISALRVFAESLKAHNVHIWVRRAGPNYQEGLRKIKAAAIELGLPMHVYGPETHMTAVVSMGLGLSEALPEPDLNCDPTRMTPAQQNVVVNTPPKARKDSKPSHSLCSVEKHVHVNGCVPNPMSKVYKATQDTTCIVYGLQKRAVQGMLDFDFISKRSKPSVAAIVYPFGGDCFEKFYWGTSEILVPVVTTIKDAMEHHPNVTVMVNFASFRSVYDTVMDALDNHSDKLELVAIIAEGVPERQARLILKKAEDKSVVIIGPATVGGIAAGRFRIGNTGGMLDNVVMSKLYRPGSVAYVSKSGGMSNELNNMIARTTDGVYSGVAIGGDRYPGSRFLDHFAFFEEIPEIKMIVLLGEVGGVDEYDVIDAMRKGKLTKPIIAWCVGTVGDYYNYEVQFGHAGAQARGQMETAMAKNAALEEAGAHVPRSFDDLPQVIRNVYEKLVSAGTIIPRSEPPVPAVPMDYTWAKNLGLVRKPANFISSISDERGEELKYNNVSISAILERNMGIGGVIGLLWFKTELPDYCCRFIEYVLMITADHGPAVSGAHNTIVTARAGKDLISSVASGLLTIGPRFGGALDEAATTFARACGVLLPVEGEPYDLPPKDFVTIMKKRNKLIMGIGHRVKSVTNPDKRVELIKDFAFTHFKDHKVLNYVLEVEKITTAKKANLILNVDGAIAACFVDMIRSCGAFTDEAAGELLEYGCLNGLFLLGRSIGFIGHYVDQRRLRQPLYRHPWDDIAFVGDS
eukprot:GEMP01001223.1.p1 GENE.GEMP01001223.1~~GEMP01001223.1.p1  ORF type:complete len:1110 (+),score=290.64 GEMP01001223.1:109-3438(+)